MLPAKPLPLGNDYLIRVYLTEYDADSNTYIAATGLTDVLATFTRDAAGETPLSVALTDIALAELSVSGDPDNAGWYTAVVEAVDLDATLDGYDKDIKKLKRVTDILGKDDAVLKAKALAALEQIVQQLERGDVPLDQSISLYERGEALRIACQQRLDAAQARIERCRPASKASFWTGCWTPRG
jgi:exodeoxyribonuclease VII small subunit